MTKREFSVAGAHQYDYRSPVRWMLSHLRRDVGLLIGMAVLIGGSNLLYSTIAALTGQAFNEVLQPQPSRDALLGISLGILGVVTGSGLTNAFGHFANEFLGKRLERDAREELYVSLLGKSQTFHNRQRVGDLMARAANDVRQLSDMIVPGVDLIVDSIAPR